MSLEIYNQNNQAELYRRVPQDMFDGNSVQQAFQFYHLTPDILARVFVEDVELEEDLDFYTYTFEDWFYYYLDGTYYYQYSTPYEYFIYYDIFYYIYEYYIEYYYIFYDFFNTYEDFYYFFYYLFWGYPGSELINSTSFLWFNYAPPYGSQNIMLQGLKELIFPNPQERPVGTQGENRLNAFLGEQVDVPFYIGFQTLGENYTDVVLTPIDQLGDNRLGLVKMAMTQEDLDSAISGQPLVFGDITTPGLEEFWIRVNFPSHYLPLSIPFLNIYSLGLMLTGESGEAEIPAVGFIAGGYDSGYSRTNVIEYFDAEVTTGNATDRGDLTVARNGLAGLQGSDYGFYGGGNSSGDDNIIDWIDVTSLSGNATDRGDLNNDYNWNGTSSFWGSDYGFFSVNPYDDIESFDIATTTGNATNRDSFSYGHDGSQGMSGSSYSVIGPGGETDNFERFDNTITSFTTSARDYWRNILNYACVSAIERDIGILLGGQEYDPYNGYKVDYMREIDLTSASGSGSDRGDLTIAKEKCVGIAGGEYGYVSGGEDENYEIIDVIEYFDLTVSSGSASDRGDLTEEKFETGGCYSGL